MADKAPSLHPRWEWRSLPREAEVFTEPSMVEPVHNLTIEEILQNYSRGIMPKLSPTFYDAGEDVEEVEVFDDILDIQPDSLHGTTHKDPVPDPDLPPDIPDPTPPTSEE